MALSRKQILVTGGAGYIGSHVVHALGERGYNIVSFDNLSTGHPWAILHGDLEIGDLCDKERLYEVMSSRRFDAVVHLAAHISVPESVEEPLRYYQNNVAGTLNLLEVMQQCSCRVLVYSSSAAVYGEPAHVPVSETAPLQPINPYGRTKAIVEDLLADIGKNQKISYIALRYFNVAGADPQGSIGEGKCWAPHLITQALRVALGQKPCLEIYGTDYATRDGTGERDYIHVADLAQAHLLCLEHLLRCQVSGVYNCGYGRGYTVREVLAAVEVVTGVQLPVEYAARRAGDPPVLIADSSKIRQELNWCPKFESLKEIISSAWHWEKKRLLGT